ncbi:MAG: glycosyltransferase [Flavobacteriales bacterium]|nr:glycosyltransferase [Flavobacteriales bacterium]
MKAPRILVCPLDWGLGHASRCIPVIHELLSQGAEPVIAADNNPLALLRKEFPTLEWKKFPGTSIVYAGENESMTWSMMKQMPRALKGIHDESKWIDMLLQKESIDGIISDNRFGAYSSKVSSVYITHQINIQTHNPITDYAAGVLHRFYMNRFTAWWIPDFEGSENLSGVLSHDVKKSDKLHYIGPLSRMEVLPVKPSKYDAGLILSGPEPQRTLLENQFVQQAAQLKEQRFLLIRGTTDAELIPPENVQILELADHHQIAEAYAESRVIICRSGYSSLMDLWKLNIKAVLIPTPGQTEQEYLARHFSEKWGFPIIKQKDFVLSNIMQIIENEHFAFHKKEMDKLKSTVSDWLSAIKKTP